MINIKNKTLITFLALSLGFASTLSAGVLDNDAFYGAKNKTSTVKIYFTKSGKINEDMKQDRMASSLYEANQLQFVNEYTKG